jgi:predicted Zn finger-like uncharacterized protein
MPLVIHCPSCSKRYQVADTLAGKQVRCQQCGTTFAAVAATAPATPVAVAPLAASDPLAGLNLSSLPAAPGANPGGSFNPLGTPPGGLSGPSPLGNPVSMQGGYSPAGVWMPSAGGGVSNPSGGPTDFGMRIACGVMVAGSVLLAVLSLVMLATTDTVYLALVALIPLFLMLGVAGLISPNVVRGMGKYGGHLSWHYKAIGYGILGLYFVVLILLMVGMFAAGFQPDRPGRPRGERQEQREHALAACDSASPRSIQPPACGRAAMAI